MNENIKYLKSLIASNLVQQLLHRSLFKKKMYSLISDIENFCKDNDLKYKTFIESLYLYVYQIKDKPKCRECNNKETRFNGIHKGYTPFCSSICANINEETKTNRDNTNLKRYGVKKFLSSKKIREQIAKTNIEIYGVDNPLKNKDIQKQIAKTNIERYGVDNVLKNKEIKEKGRDTLFKNYGVRNTFDSKEIRDKAKETMIERHGTEIPMQNNEIKEKFENTCLEKYGTKSYLGSLDSQEKNKDSVKTKKLKIIKEYLGTYLKFINYIKEENYIECSCLKCDHRFRFSFQTIYLRHKSNKGICPKCYPNVFLGYSGGEKELYNFIKENYNGEIIENNRIIKPYELDVYLPDLKLAFEYDGIYWHSDEYKSKDYHLMKSNMCKKLGIRLIHIFEDNWLNKSEIIKSMILNCLGVIKNKIFARKCIIKEINYKITNKFLENNHIQGNCPSKINYGLYFKDELVSIMTFGRRAIFKNSDIELLRYCNKLNTSIIGGASKLFSYFLKENININKIISYCDISRNTGLIYDKLGFSSIRNTEINYFWVNQGMRYSRHNFTKQKLIKLNWLLPEETESDCMYRLGYNKFYDCGSMLFEWNRVIQ